VPHKIDLREVRQQSEREEEFKSLRAKGHKGLPVTKLARRLVVPLFAAVLGTLLLPSECGAGQPIAFLLSPDERAYWSQSYGLMDTVVKSLLFVDAGGRNPPDWSPEFPGFMTELARRWSEGTADCASRLRRMTAPPLFRQYHEQRIRQFETTARVAVLLRETTGLLVPLIGKINGSCGKDRECRKRLATERPDLSRRWNSLWTRYNERHANLGVAFVTTDDAAESALTRINGELVARSPVRIFARLLQNLNSFGDASLAFSFQPWVIPVKVTINSNLEVSLSAETEVPTFIGVFSLSAQVAKGPGRILVVTHRGKKHVWSLGNRPFAFSVPDYTGNVDIAVGESGNVFITLW